MLDEIEQIIACFVDAIEDMCASGFDGVQLHAAHGGLLSRFLSPYTNRRQDCYGGSPENRAMISREIVQRARQRVADWPILIKTNSTDYLEGGLDGENFPALASEIAKAGVDAIELSGGMWECLFRPEAELGFRAVPAPESHTRIRSPEKQSFFGIRPKARFAHSCDPDWGQPTYRHGSHFAIWNGGFYCPVPAVHSRT